MAIEPSNAVSSSSQSPSSSSVDSYIGSIISLTSKYEIRYEGVLCYLNPQDSTLGLKNVRSYGTEGRKKDGPQIPASEKLYEYILFRGSDIKDLDVKSSAPSQKDDPIHNDPAVIQSHRTVAPSSLSNSASVGGGSLMEFSSYQGYPALTNVPNPISMSSYLSANPIGPWGPTQTIQSANMASFPMPMYWQGYNGASSTIPSVSQFPITSVPVPTNIAQSLPQTLQNPLQAAVIQASTNIAFPNISNDLNIIDAPVIGKAGSGPACVISAQPLPSSASPVLDATSCSLLDPPPTLLTPERLLLSRLPVLSASQKPFLNSNMGTLNSTSLNSVSSMTPPVVQEPLLPLPLSSPKSRDSEPQYTDEFDFEAMNEKFKKDEIWGYLGNQKQCDEVEGIQDNAKGQNLGDEALDSSATKFDSKPAYNKDEFFDTISCNSLVRGVRNEHNRFSERMRMDNETFGNFQQRLHLQYGGYGTRTGNTYRGPFNSGRGYHYRGRGYGGNFRV